VGGEGDGLRRGSERTLASPFLRLLRGMVVLNEEVRAAGRDGRWNGLKGKAGGRIERRRGGIVGEVWKNE
jgi:hypothetical protein